MQPIREKIFTFILWLKKPTNGLWITPTLWALLAGLLVFLASLTNHFPDIHWKIEITHEFLNDVLDILASSMLAVTTFSLSIMVAAFASAASGATPRATELVMGDDTTRVTIASFISAFVYAVIAKIALGMGSYNALGRFILFFGTLCELAYLIYILINWVRALSLLGRLNNTLEKIEIAARQALIEYRTYPNMGAKSIESVRFDCPIKATKSGYLGHINMQALSDFAIENDCLIDIAVRPGGLIYSGMTLACINKPIEDSARLAESFIINDDRCYDQDPKFGLLVLSEAAQRALSKAVNDPGTAIKVLTILMRLLLDAKGEKQAEKYPHLAMVALNEEDFILQPFSAICRDGESMLEIHIKIQKILHIIAENAQESSLRVAAKKQAKIDLEYALNGLALESEKMQIKQLYNTFFG